MCDSSLGLSNIVTKTCIIGSLVIFWISLSSRFGKRYNNTKKKFPVAEILLKGCIMILSASRRTDIPCYFSEWFMNRIREGYVLSRNPMNYNQISRIALSPNVVDCIVFWTKDAANILPYLDELDGLGFRYYFQYTITPYGCQLEKNLREKSGIEDSFVELSRRIGRERVVWRYDPVLYTEGVDFAYHREHFVRMCEKLAAYSDTVMVSFIDIYAKVKSSGLRALREDEMTELAEFFRVTAKEYGIRASACCERSELLPEGMEMEACIDRRRVERICGYSLALPSEKNQRDGCRCCASVDIGAYNSCVNGCVYCYANRGTSGAEKYLRSHNPKGELLVGTLLEGEKVSVRKVESHRIFRQEL